MSQFVVFEKCMMGISIKLARGRGEYCTVNGEEATWTAMKTKEEVLMKARNCDLCDGTKCVFAIRGGEVLNV